MAQETIGDLVIQLSANVNRLSADLAQANRVVEQQAGQMQRAFADAGRNIVAGLATAFAAVNFADLIKSSIDAADKIQDVANRSGAGVKALSELKFAAEQSGTSFDALSRGLTIIAKNAAAAAGGNEKLAATFAAAGIGVKTAAGELKSADVLLQDLADRFAAFKDGPEKTALALQLFGKAGAELVPLLNEGKAGLAAFAAEAERLNVSLDEGFTQQAADFNDAFDKIKTAVQGAGLELAKTLLPALQSGAEGLTKFIVAARESGTLSALAEGIKLVLTNLDDLAVGVATFVGARGISGFIASLAAGGASLATFGAAIKAAGAAMLAFAASPAGIALALAGAAVALYKFSDSADDLSTRLEAGIATLDKYKSALSEIKADQFATIAQDFAQAIALLQDVEGRIESLNSAGPARGKDSALAQLEAQATSLRGQIEKLRPGLEGLARSNADQLIANLGKAFKGASDAGKTLPPLLGDIDKESRRMAEAQREAEQAAKGLADALKQQLDVQERILRAELAQSQAQLESSRRFADALESQDRQIALLQATGAERERLLQIFRVEELTLSTLGKRYDELNEKERAEYEIRYAALLLGDKTDQSWRKQSAAIEQLAASYERMAETARDAFGDLLAGVTDIEGFFDRLGDSSKRFFSDLISNAIKSGKSIKEIFADLGKNNIVQNGFNLQNTANALGSGYNAYQSFRQGDTAGTVINAYQLGNAIGGSVGGIIAASIAAVASLFRGSKEPDLRLGGIGNTRKPEQTFTTSLGQFQVGARGLEGKESEFIEIVRNFDQGLASIISSFRGGQERLSEVQAALQRLSVDLKGSAITAENVLGPRFQAILGTFSADIQAFVGLSGTLEERIARLADASAIEATVGIGLFESFTQAADVLSDLQREGEKFTDTYLRVVGSVDLLQDVLDGLGQAAASSGEQFARFATGLTDALGGLQSAVDIIGQNINAFLSEQERQEFRRAQARSALSAAGTDAGITGILSNDEFKDLLNQALSGAFSPDRAAAILRYGAALARFNAAMAEGAEAAQNLTAPSAIAVLTPEEVSAARQTGRQTLQALLGGLSAAVGDFGATDYDRQVAGFRAAFKETEQALIDASIAAGRTGVDLGGLADAIDLLQLQTEQAYAELRKTVLRSLIDLFPSEPLTFTSELDLLTRGMGAAGDQATRWIRELRQLEKLDAVTTLARNLRSLFEGSGGVAGLKDLLGGNGDVLRKLLADFGVSFGDIFSESNLRKLAAFAKLLGISFNDLAGLLNLDLSGLSATTRDDLNNASAQDAPKIVDTTDPETTAAVDNVAAVTEQGLSSVKAELAGLRGDFRALADELTRIRTNPAGQPA